jgi:streptogramin lyase
LRWLVGLFAFAFLACPTLAQADPTLTEFTGGVTPGFSANRDPEGITVGPDHNIWFAEQAGDLARINPDGSVSEFTLTTESRPMSVTTGPDGNMWYSDPTDSRVGRRNSDGTFTELTGGVTPGFSANAAPWQITSGPDGHIWFAEHVGLARVNGDGTVTEFPAALPQDSEPIGITTGPDGNMWFAFDVPGGAPGGLGRLNPNGTVTLFRAGTTPGMASGYNFFGITTGLDANIWYTRGLANSPGVGRLNAGGTATEFTQGTTPGFGSATNPAGITVGCDGDIWWADWSGGVGRLNPDGTVTRYPGSGGFGVSAVSRWITSGPDGNIWFTEDVNPGRVARLTPPPGAETGAASSVSRHSATLQGTVRPCNQPTVYSFQYGTGTGYGNATTPVGLPGTLSPLPAAGGLVGLQPNTVYHYRLVATNHSGTTYGADRVFMTPPIPPLPLNARVTVLGAFPAVFAAQSRGPSATFAKVHLGTTVRFTLTQAATVRFTVTKRVPGRQVKRGKKKLCVRPTSKNRTHKHCSRVVTLKGSFTINGKAGKNRFHFTGRLNHRKIPPGRYRLVATPIVGGRAAVSVSTVIQIVG